LCEEDLRDARLVVAVKEAEHRRYLEQQFPGWADRVRYWHVHDLDQSEPAAAMGDVEDRVKALVAELGEQG
jgi:protein-tyrosine phosphatase